MFPSCKCIHDNYTENHGNNFWENWKFLADWKPISLGLHYPPLQSLFCPRYHSGGSLVLLMVSRRNPKNALSLFVVVVVKPHATRGMDNYCCFQRYFRLMVFYTTHECHQLYKRPGTDGILLDNLSINIGDQYNTIDAMWQSCWVRLQNNNF